MSDSPEFNIDDDAAADAELDKAGIKVDPKQYPTIEARNKALLEETAKHPELSANAQRRALDVMSETENQYLKPNTETQTGTSKKQLFTDEQGFIHAEDKAIEAKATIEDTKTGGK